MDGNRLCYPESFSIARLALIFSTEESICTFLSLKLVANG